MIARLFIEAIRAADSDEMDRLTKEAEPWPLFTLDWELQWTDAKPFHLILGETTDLQVPKEKHDHQSTTGTGDQGPTPGPEARQPNPELPRTADRSADAIWA